MGTGKIGAHRAIALSVVVPCYNERDGVAELHRRVSAVCLEQSPSYEIVLVIDGATDGTREAIFELAEKDDHVVAIDLARNYGHQIALSAGLEFCRGERILLIDADLQDPPELVGEMMRLMDEGAEVVYGKRAERAKAGSSGLPPRCSTACSAGWSMSRSHRTPETSG